MSADSGLHSLFSLRPRRMAVLILGLMLLIPAVAHGQTSIEKWTQPPDDTPLGIDVNDSYQWILADDFECRSTGPITEITVWGSWRGDYLPMGGDPAAVLFTLSFHADIPAGPGEYSRPGEVLWTRSFNPGDFLAEPWFQGIPEGWLDPPDQYGFPADFTCWRYTFRIPTTNAFVQAGNENEPTVYWLDVKAVPLDPQAFFGWKTSATHWNDDAVWGQGEEPYPGPWFELRYPPGHELQGHSIDLAFSLITEIQELDFGDAPDPGYPTRLASGGACHRIVPGIQLGTSIDPEPDGQPDPIAMGDDNDGNDDEDGVTLITPLIPGQPAQIRLVASVFGLSGIWIDYGANGNWSDAIDFAGYYALNPGPNTVTINVPAVAVGGPTFMRVRFTTAGPPGVGGFMADGEVEDYRVTIEVPEPFKWLQQPDLDQTGIDVNATGPLILADDFLCRESGAITEIHVWGSWRSDEVAPVPFVLSFHADIPAGPDNEYSMPGEPLWVRTFQPGEYEERVYVEGIQEGWMDPPDQYVFPGDTICFEYVFHVPMAAAFVQRGSPDRPVVYWLDVQALSITGGGVFGWKTSLDHWNDDAVWGSGIEPYPGPWRELRYPPQHPFHPESIDLAFALRSEPVPEEWDFGDAPDPGYPTLLASNGARHLLGSGLFFGNTVDPEPDGQPDPNAMGDDMAGIDDEDGVLFTSGLFPGVQSTIQITLSQPGWVDGWIDFGGDGSWAEAADHFLSGPFPGGTTAYVFPVPATTPPGATYARFRVNSIGPLPPDGPASDGEVEDGAINVFSVDYGDAPDGLAAPGYPTLLANNGARHAISSTVFLGAGIDAEPDGQPHPQALGDDLAGIDDEDGVTWLTPLIPGWNASVDVVASVNGHLDVWIDYDGNMSWADPGENVFSSGVSAGNNTVTFTVPAAAVPGNTYARFRFARVGPLPVDGPVVGGEVEDTMVTIKLPPERKWEQPPDLGLEGIDVSASGPYILADDFLCTEPGRIVEIRVWGSWLNDYLPFGQDPLAVDFILSFHEDIPAEQSPTGYSMPGEPVWWRTFPAASFTAIPFNESPEGFMWPPDEYIFPGDQMCWWYTFRVPVDEAFEQLGNPDFPKVYWLDIKAMPHDPAATWGWKTSRDHWNDDATWGIGEEPYPGPWNELRYPPPHPFHPESIDLAFALFHHPLPYEPDFGDAPDMIGGPSYQTLLGNNGARHVIVPGVRMGAALDGEPDGQPDAMALGDDNAGLDDEDGVTFTSVFRAGWIATWNATFSVAGHLDVWLDWNANHSWADPGEHIHFGPVSAGTNTFSWHVPITAQPGRTYMRFRFNTAGPLGYAGPAPDGEVEDYRVTILETTDAPGADAPEVHFLHPAAPNPFGSATTLGFDLPAESPVRIDIYAVDGRRVITLVDETRPAGRHAAVWDGRDANGRPVAAGIYIVRMNADAFTQTRRLVRLR